MSQSRHNPAVGHSLLKGSAKPIFQMKKHAAAWGFRGLIAGSLLLIGSLTANASIEYQFNAAFPNDTAPSSAPVWVDAYFIDGAPGSGIVYMTVTNVGLSSGEFIQGGSNGNGNGANGATGGLFFNLNTSLNVSDLGFTFVSQTANFGTMISTGEDGFQADGDGLYNIQIDFSTHLFSVDSSFTYELTLTNGDLTASDFEQLSDPKPGDSAGPYYAAAKIMGVSGAPGGSTYIEPNGGYTVLSAPEPAPIALLATGLTLLIARTLRRRRP